MIFKVRLPFWTTVWGWSLVLTNLLSLPLLNMVGLFLEESEERDYLGLFSFIILSYILAPFQAYASVKGFFEKEEGPWFRTPKTGRITDIFERGKFYRWLSGIIPWRTPALAQSMVKWSDSRMALWRVNTSFNNPPARNAFNTADAGGSSPIHDLPSINPYLSLATANNRFNTFKIRSRNKRWLGRMIISLLLILTVSIYHLTYKVSEVYATNPVEPFTIDSAASANMNTSWQFKENATWSTVDSTTKTTPGTSKASFQYIPGTNNITAGTPNTAAPTGKGWIYDTAFQSSGSIADGNWVFTLCTSDSDTDNKGGGYPRFLAWKVALTGIAPNQTIDAANLTNFFDTTTGCSATNLWTGGTNTNRACTNNPTGTTYSFDATQKYLYIEIWDVVNDANDDLTDNETFHAGNGSCATDPQIDPPTTVIPEVVILLIFVVPFIPITVNLYRRQKLKVSTIMQAKLI